MAYAGTVWLSGTDSSTVKARVDRILRHPSYNADTADYDVALLELAEPFVFSKYVQPACLPAASHRFPPRKKCLISGWGYLKEDFCKQDLPCLWVSQAGRGWGVHRVDKSLVGLGWGQSRFL